jgi:hypothetical protein
MTTTTTLTVAASVESHSDGYTVWADWTAADVTLDRPRTHGISTGRNKDLAERLAAAINAGAVYPDPEVRTDVYGATYVQASSRVMGRHLNADLRRLGF